MKSLYEFRYDLTEKVSSVVYHKTTMKNIASIMNTDQFSLAGTAFVSGEMLLPMRKNSKNMYYMSFSQSKNSSFNRDRSSLHGILTIDGDILSQNYRGGAVDWTNMSGAAKPKNFTQRFENDESEDRVISDKPFIPNATKYIKAIDLFIPFRMRLDGVYSHKKIEIQQEFRDIMRIAKLKGIPVRVYDNDTSKYALTGKNYLKPEEYDYMYDDVGKNNYTPSTSSMSWEVDVRKLYTLSKIMTSKNESEFDEETRKDFNALKNSLAVKDGVFIAIDWFSNHKIDKARLSSDATVKKYYHKIYSVMVRNNLRYHYDVIKFLSDKYGLGYEFKDALI